MNERERTEKFLDVSCKVCVGVVGICALFLAVYHLAIL